MPQNQIAFVISDAFLMRKGISEFFIEKGYIVKRSDEPSILDKEVLDSKADLLLFDLDHTSHKPEKVLAIANFLPNCKVIVFSESLEEVQLNQLSSYGVTAFLQTHCKEEKLTEALAQIEQGNTYKDSDLTQQHVETANLFLSLNISEREIEIIKLIAEGYINKEIADRLFLSTHTVNTHRKNIMQKLGINNTAGIVLFAVKQGIVSTNEFLFH